MRTPRIRFRKRHFHIPNFVLGGYFSITKRKDPAPYFSISLNFLFWHWDVNIIFELIKPKINMENTKVSYLKYMFQDRRNISVVVFMLAFTAIWIFINAKEGSLAEVMPYSWPIWGAWLVLIIATYVLWRKKMKKIKADAPDSDSTGGDN